MKDVKETLGNIVENSPIGKLMNSETVGDVVSGIGETVKEIGGFIPSPTTIAVGTLIEKAGDMKFLDIQLPKKYSKPEGFVQKMKQHLKA